MILSFHKSRHRQTTNIHILHCTFSFFLHGTNCTVEKRKSQSAKICLNFNFQGGGGYSATEKSQSAKICLNFNFFWGGGYSATGKSQSAKICLNFNFQGGILQLKSQSAKICINFNGGGVFCNWKITKCQDLPKFQFSGGGVFCNWKVKVPRSA